MLWLRNLKTSSILNFLIILNVPDGYVEVPVKQQVLLVETDIAEQKMYVLVSQVAHPS